MSAKKSTKTKKKAGHGGYHGVPCSPSLEVPFNTLPLRDITIHSGVGCTCQNGSIVEVWRIEGDDGFHIKLRRKLDDGRMSLLDFGMSLEAATALAAALQMQICPDENMQDRRPKPEGEVTKTQI
jgi:hypothetical protein